MEKVDVWNGCSCSASRFGASDLTTSLQTACRWSALACLPLSPASVAHCSWSFFLQPDLWFPLLVAGARNRDQNTEATFRSSLAWGISRQTRNMQTPWKEHTSTLRTVNITIITDAPTNSYTSLNSLKNFAVGGDNVFFISGSLKRDGRGIWFIRHHAT